MSTPEQTAIKDLMKVYEEGGGRRRLSAASVTAADVENVTRGQATSWT
ncbi:MAG: hypothetical protein H0T78_04535 [Longispora sp.]|nr:hypothetical protein [Longispora sp. (in: high G+C Gram-positive bacteria)]